MEFSQAETEASHIAIAELIANTKILIKSSQVSQDLNKQLIKSYDMLSDKFLNREKMLGFEMDELLESLKVLSKAIEGNTEASQTFDKKALAQNVNDILSRSTVSDKTKSTVASTYSSALTGKDLTSNINELTQQLSDFISNQQEQARLEKLQTPKAISQASNTDAILKSYVDKDKTISLEDLAKKKADRISSGSMAGGINYVEDLFGVNGASDFISEKLGDLFGLKNLKEKFISNIETSAKKLYKGIEEFLPDALKLDDKRFYKINQEIIANSTKVLDGIDNDLAALLIQRDKDYAKLQSDLNSGTLTLEEFESKVDSLDANILKKKEKLDKQRDKVHADIEEAMNSIMDVDLGGIRENLYMTIETNRRQMQQDIAERQKLGIISEAEIQKTISDFRKTEMELKKNLTEAYKKNSEDFDLSDYISNTNQNVRNGIISLDTPKTNQELQELNTKFDQFLDYQKAQDRMNEINSDIFDKPEEDTEEKEDSGLPKTNLKEQQEKGDQMIMDTLGDFLGFGEGKGKRRGRSRGKRSKGFLGKLGRLGSKIVSPLAATGLGQTVSAVASSGGKLLSSGANLLKGGAKFLGPIGAAITAGMAVKDGIDGWDRAGQNFDLKEGQEATTGQKASSAAGSILSGLSFGLLDEKSTAQGIHSVGTKIADTAGAVKDKIADFFGFGSKKDDKENKDESLMDKAGDLAKKVMESTPLGMVSNKIASFFGSDSAEDKKSDKLVKKKEADKNDKIIELLETLTGQTPNSSGNMQITQQTVVHTRSDIDDLGIKLLNNGAL